MIDWEQTQQRFGYNTLPSAKRPKVVCICNGCEKHAIITVRVKTKVVDDQMQWFCPSCVKLRESDAISARMKKQWEDEEYRKKITSYLPTVLEDDKIRAKHSVAVREGMKSVDMSSILTARYKNQQARDILREKSLVLWRDKSFRERVAKGVEQSAVLNGAPSSLHKQFQDYANDLGLEVIPEFAVGPYNFDFYIERPTRSLLIEINGDYWHSLTSSVERDKRKASYLLNLQAEYELMVLWEHEFYTAGRVQTRLREKFGIDQPRQIDFNFDDIEIRLLEDADARLFFSKYHYTGSLGRGGIKIGAFLHDELIAAAVVAHVVRKEVATRLKLTTKQVREISRFCIHTNYHKYNFGTWFLARVVRLIGEDNAIKCLIAFADDTFGHSGTIYKSANFVLDGMVEPSYSYVDNRGWIMHKKTLYEQARSLRLTESEYATKYGFRKIFGSHKTRYVYWMH